MVIFHSYVKLPEGTLHSPESKHPAGSGQNQVGCERKELRTDKPIFSKIRCKEWSMVLFKAAVFIEVLHCFMHWDLQKREQDLCSIEPYRAISWIKNTG